MTNGVTIKPYPGPAGGWGSVKSVARHTLDAGRLVTANLALLKQNKPDGFSCVSCSWAKPDKPLAFEYCENGAKATAWETTRKRIHPRFFEAHTTTQLLAWSDHDLEARGRLLHPMRLDRARDRWVRVTWADASDGAGGRALPGHGPTTPEVGLSCGSRRSAGECVCG